MARRPADPGSSGEFEALRPRLLQIARGLLGDVAEADDVVQDAWLRYHGADRAAIHNLRGWLATTVANLALDRLTSASRRHEFPVGGVGRDVADTSMDVQPAERVIQDDLVASTLRRVVAILSPAERTAFLLHDVFGFSFADIARLVGRTPLACRQLAARARRRIVADAPRFLVTADEEARMIDAFVVACAGGDIVALLTEVDPGLTARLAALRGAEEE
jgi:RNA polymerase sigma-70 factor, ECF subfamily